MLRTTFFCWDKINTLLLSDFGVKISSEDGKITKYYENVQDITKSTYL